MHDHNLRVLFSLKSLGYFFIQFMVGAMKLISACTPDNSTLANYIQQILSSSSDSHAMK